MDRGLANDVSKSRGVEHMKYKRIGDQVIVITGASSGIGFATAIAAAKQGARVVLAGRSITSLNVIAEELARAGGDALAVECDVCDRGQMEDLASAAVRRFGCIDTWVNNAGVGMFGSLIETSEDDARRLFDTNFWGVVNGSV